MQGEIKVPLRFPNVHHYNAKYEDGVTKNVNEIALLKVPLGNYKTMPSLRIQTAGTGGTVGFIDRGDKTAAQGRNSPPPKVGEGRFS